MSSEKYLDKLRAGGDIILQLRAHAKEYDGPCGQSSTVITANMIKKQALLEAAKTILDLQDQIGILESQVNLFRIRLENK
jgi:hypothetical protein